MHARTTRTGLGLVVATTALALTAAVAGPLAGTASAGTTTDPAKVGLYGGQDPTFDGVYRQSLALLALAAAGTAPAPTAVAWLLAQQCADGGFEAFRADLSKPCSPPSSTAFSGEDVNSTGIAVQALHAVGKGTQAAKAVAWLGGHQSADGGWAYYPDGKAGNASDANSTALGLSAYLALGQPAPTGGAGGATPYDALLGMQVGCSGAVADRGAFTFGGTANDYATVQAALAVGGGFLPVPAQSLDAAEPAPTCPGATWTRAEAADYSAGYLARRLGANGHVVPDPFNPGQTDYGSTANAVLALVASGHGSTQVPGALAALAANVDAYAKAKGADVPGALGTLVLAAVAGGDDPTSFGGTNLVSRLAATLTTKAVAPPPSPSPTPSKPSTAPAPHATSTDPTLPATGDSRAAGGGLIGTLLVGAGIALVVTARRGRHRGRRSAGA
jgi:LPXTG-motif cell wall-anchored protein